MIANRDNNHSRHHSKERPSGSGVRALVRDVIELIELQALLVRTGLRESTEHMKLGGVCGAVAAIVTLAALLLLMQSAAGFLASGFDITAATAELIVGTLALLGAAATAAVAAKKLSRTIAVVAEASDELAANLRAVKEALSPAQPESARYESALRDLDRGSR